MKKLLILLAMGTVLVPALVLSGSSVRAEIPRLINYQGMLTDDWGAALTDTVYITFRIYDDSLSAASIDKKWEEIHPAVPVIGGLFNVYLGTVDTLDLDFSEDYWLDVTVGTDHMNERVRFVSVAYAYRALVADSAAVAGSGGGGGGGWVDDGTVVRLDTATDSVGIGTATPLAPFHVAGGAQIDGDLHMGGKIKHNSPVQIKDGLVLIDSLDVERFHIEIEGHEGHHLSEGIPDDLHGTMVFETHNVQNPYNMEITFWDSDIDRPALIINEGGTLRASTFDRSLQIGKALGAAAVDSNYTKLEGFNYLDGNTGATGADLGVEDDIEAKGGIYSQEDLVAEGDLRLADSDASNYVAFQAPATVGADVTWTLPNADGSTGQALITDGSGALSWADAAAGDITAVGSMTSGDVFADATATGDWLGLGAAAGRIEFDDEATDEVNILDANVGIGTPSPTQRLDVNGNARIRSIGSGTYSAPVNQTSDGTLTTATSDVRLKKNVATIENALDKVLNLRGVTFNWKDDKNHPRRMTGMIAQEVIEVMPELVFQNPADGYYGINYGESSGLLIEAIKELKEHNEVQRNAISALQQRLADLELKVNNGLVSSK